MHYAVDALETEGPPVGTMPGRLGSDARTLDRPRRDPRLRDAIRHLHGVESKHFETVHVPEVHAGQLEREGDIEVFWLAVLHAVGVDTPVRAAHVTYAQKARV